MSSPVLIDDIRAMLRSHEAILVHFNTPATKHPIGYPEDLRDALANPSWKMCHSTIMPRDRGPMQIGPGEEAEALGSVGLLVDLDAESRIETVCNLDAGSDGRVSSDAFGEIGAPATCEASIVDRKAGHNEWLVANAIPLGIFLFARSRVYIRAADGELDCPWQQVVADFPGQRIFSKLDGVWQEFVRATGIWEPRTYDEIVIP